MGTPPETVNNGRVGKCQQDSLNEGRGLPPRNGDLIELGQTCSIEDYEKVVVHVREVC